MRWLWKTSCLMRAARLFVVIPRNSKRSTVLGKDSLMVGLGVLGMGLAGVMGSCWRGLRSPAAAFAMRNQAVNCSGLFEQL